MDSINVVYNNNTNFDKIKDVMIRAHNAARNDRLSFPTSSMTTDDYLKTISDGGKWFVAMDGNKIVGTIYGIKTYTKNWFYNGESIVIKYVAVLPEYSGHGIVSKLYNKIFEYAKLEDCPICIMSMSEYNFHHQHVATKNGFKLMDFYAVKGLKNYTLCYAYWINSICPVSDGKIKIAIFIRKVKARLKRLIIK